MPSPPSFNVKMTAVAVLAVSTLLATETVAASVKAKDKCELTHADRCTAGVLPFANGLPLSTTAEELAEECRNSTKAIKCLSDLSTPECVPSGVALGVFKLLIEGAERESGLRCDSSHPKGQDYFKYIHCLNKVSKKLQTCQVTMAANNEALLKRPVTERIPRLCCNYRKLYQCMHDEARAGCSEEHGKYVAGILSGIAEDAVETICSRYKSDTCKQLSQIRAPKKPKYSTLIPSVVEAVNLS